MRRYIQTAIATLVFVFVAGCASIQPSNPLKTQIIGT